MGVGVGLVHVDVVDIAAAAIEHQGDEVGPRDPLQGAVEGAEVIRGHVAVQLHSAAHVVEGVVGQHGDGPLLVVQHHQ